MIIEKNLVLTKEGKRPIVYDIFRTEGIPKARIIFCHGYKGFKDWGAWHLVAPSFAEAGYEFWKFNFSHNGGTVDNPIDFPDLQAFSMNNYSLEVEDLGRMIDLVDSQEGELPIYVIGHSRGGGIALLRASQDDRIRKVASWAGVSDYRSRFFEGSPAFEAWKETGITHVENSRTGQMLPHKWQLYEDFIANEDKLTISKAVKSLEIPQLIVHGGIDPTVGLKEAEALHKWNPASLLVIIEEGDHVFGMKHPWEDTTLPDTMQTVVGQTLDFFDR